MSSQTRRNILVSQETRNTIALSMMMMSSSDSICIICYKSIKDDDKNEVFETGKNNSNFLLFVTRYLNNKFGNITTDNKRARAHSFHFKVIKNGNRNRQPPPLCHDCTNLGASFSQLFCELECVRLKLDWKVFKIFETMRCADRVPSRVAAFRKYLGEEEEGHGQVTRRRSGRVNEDEEEKEGPHSQTVGGSDNEIEQFRNELLNHYKLHMKWSQPKVSLKEMDLDAVGSKRRSNSLILEGELEAKKAGFLGSGDTLQGAVVDGVEVTSSLAGRGRLQQLLSFLAVVNLLLIPVAVVPEPEQEGDAAVQSNLDSSCSQSVEGDEVDEEQDTHFQQHQEHCSSSSSQVRADLKTEIEDERCSSPDAIVTSPAQDDADSDKSKKAKLESSNRRGTLVSDSKAKIEVDNEPQTGSAEEWVDSHHLPTKKSLRSLLKCDHCSKTFSQQSKLNRHLASHKKMSIISRSTPPHPLKKVKAIGSGSSQAQSPPQSCSSSSDTDSDEDENPVSSDATLDDDDEPQIRRKTRAPPNSQNWPKPDHLPVTQCEQCLESFSCQAAVEKHRVFSHNLKSFARCQGCGNLFSRFTSLRRHRSNPNFASCYTKDIASLKAGAATSEFPRFQHDHIKIFCPREGCYEAFAYKEHLQVHLNTHGSWECAHCELVFEKAHYLAWHEINNQRDGHLSVNNHQLEPLETPAQFQIGKKVYKCSRCKVKSKVKRYMISHFLSKHLGISIVAKGSGKECPICKKVLRAFASKRQMEAHIAGEHDVSSMNPKEISRCNICNAPFVYSSSLTLHMSSVHKAEKAFSCKECGKKFNQQGMLLSHVKRIHKAVGAALAKAKPGFTPFQCKVCEEKFEREGFLRAHMKSHLADEVLVFTCTVCKAPCKTKASRDAHMKLMHEETKDSFCCEECGKIFRSKLKLSLHVGKSHTDPSLWKFQCKVEGCGRRLFTKQRLTAHLRTHTKENPYVCQFCGGAYRYKSTLRAHLQRVHGPSAAATLPKKLFTKPFDKRIREKESDGHASNQDAK
ncbi:unnamed protein product [Orchesella dallaii]|uniref:C2H2-type domain-containing protein n=1 Tax=Orchesella dallaii TaxID=48710 RepID=A0ABP1SAX7_9HEXA